MGSRIVAATRVLQESLLEYRLVLCLSMVDAAKGSAECPSSLVTLFRWVCQLSRSEVCPARSGGSIGVRGGCVVIITLGRSAGLNCGSRGGAPEVSECSHSLEESVRRYR